MAKYYKHIKMIDGTKVTKCFIPEGKEMCIPEASGNLDYQRMIREVDEGTSSIEEVNMEDG